jgi:hypothetical protein
MAWTSEDLETAEQRVVAAEGQLARQIAYVEQLEAAGQDSRTARELLDVYEHAVEAFRARRTELAMSILGLPGEAGSTRSPKPLFVYLS